MALIQNNFLLHFKQIDPVHEDNENACDESNANNIRMRPLSDVQKLDHKCTENEPDTYKSRRPLSEVQNLQQNVENNDKDVAAEKKNPVIMENDGLRTSSQKSNGPSGSVSIEMQQRVGCSFENASVQVSTNPRKKRSWVNEYVSINVSIFYCTQRLYCLGNLINE